MSSLRKEVLSIPAWFDWRVPPLLAECVDRLPFNPSLVRLAQEPNILGHEGRRAFNPSLVRLAPVDEALPPPHHDPLSIPAWFDWRPGAAPTSTLPSTLSIPAWFDWRSPATISTEAMAISFNPSLVRLAHVGRGYAQTANPFFQSQLGSIGASSAQETCALRGASFNPSLVRLALMPRLPSACGFHSFNPSLVRLAPGSPTLTFVTAALSIPAWFDWRPRLLNANLLSPTTFNPSLVRLAPYWRDLVVGNSYLSIPAWFDWRRDIYLAASHGTLLSIPAWFDWRLAPPSQCPQIAHLSIPAWFDWRRLKGGK